MNTNIFVSHSNKYIEVTTYFAEFLKSRGLNPQVMEFIPNDGKVWSPPEKVQYYMSICDSALTIATPDETQDGKPVPRMDVIVELGLLKNSKKTIVLKEKTTTLPKSVDPIYISFEMNDLSSCLDQLDIELESIFGKTERRPFSTGKITKSKQLPATIDEKQRETANETLLLSAAVFYVTEAYAQMFSHGVISPTIMQGLHDQIRNTLFDEESFRNQIETSKVGPALKTLFGMEEKRDAPFCSVWPACRAYSSFAIVNKAPVGAVLTGSVLDLVFNINIPGTIFSRAVSQISSKVSENLDTIAIYIPPGFTVPAAEQIVSTISCAHFKVQRASPYDRYGPGWTVVYVSVDTNTQAAGGPVGPPTICPSVQIKNVTTSESKV